MTDDIVNLLRSAAVRHFRNTEILMNDAANKIAALRTRNADLEADLHICREDLRRVSEYLGETSKFALQWKSERDECRARIEGLQAAHNSMTIEMAAYRDRAGEAESLLEQAVRERHRTNRVVEWPRNLQVTGTGREPGCKSALTMYFSRCVSDNDMRKVHATLCAFADGREK